ncbi:MAG: methylmalonyl-CoA epimerase [Deltaproteobacteria bacterium]|nr:methylmalonyl-CoA epimerase [Deltaproteobacteria bacterium]
MLKRINHIGIVVGDFQEALTVYSMGLGMKLDKIVEIPDVQLKIGVFKIGEIEIEILHYANSELPMVKALRGNYPGVNHICYEVEEFDETLKRLMENGFKLIEGFPRKGVHGRIAFFIPPHSPEERIEILEVEA